MLLTVKVLSGRSATPLAGARIVLAYQHKPSSEHLSDVNGSATFEIPEPVPKITLEVGKRWHQQVSRDLTLEEVQQGIFNVTLQLINSWYLLQRVLEWPGDWVGAIPSCESVGKALRGAAGPVKWLAHKGWRIRTSAWIVVFVSVLMCLEFYLLPWSTAYHNWADRVGLGTLWDGPHQCLEQYKSGRSKVLGPGEVAIKRTVTIDSGAFLRIEAGTKVCLAEKVRVFVSGDLDLDGQEHLPILFCAGSEGQRWSNITVWKNGKLSVKNAILTGAGGIPLDLTPSENDEPKISPDPAVERCRGGAVFLWRSQSCTIENSRFSDCLAGAGGAVYVRQTSVQIRNCMFSRNRTLGNAGGGAVTFWRGSGTIYSSTFTGNEASSVNSDNGKGGAIYVGRESAVNIEDCEFFGNKASSDGGAIFGNLTHETRGNQDPVRIHKGNLGRGTFHKNISGGRGGAVALVGPMYAVVEGANFQSNHAREGGAIFINHVAVDGWKPHELMVVRANIFHTNASEGLGRGCDVAIYFGKQNDSARVAMEKSISDNTFSGELRPGTTRLFIDHSDRIWPSALAWANRPSLKQQEIEICYAAIKDVPYRRSERESGWLGGATWMIGRSVFGPQIPDTFGDEVSQATGDNHQRLEALCKVLNRQSGIGDKALPKGTRMISDGEPAPWVVRICSADRAWNEIVNSVRNDYPVALSTPGFHPKHVVVVTGYTSDQSQPAVLVHDPAGTPQLDAVPITWFPKEGIYQHPFKSLSALRVKVQDGVTLVQTSGATDAATSWRKGSDYELKQISKALLQLANDSQEPAGLWEYVIKANFTIEK